MSHLTRDQILAANDQKREEVNVPEWGGTVLVASFSGAARDVYDHAVYLITQGKPAPNLRATVAAASIVNEKGIPVFSSEEVNVLARKNAEALNRVFEVALRLSGMTGEAIEEVEENFADAPSSTPTTS